MFTRPGILVDAFPSPYPNEEARSGVGRTGRIGGTGGTVVELVASTRRLAEEEEHGYNWMYIARTGKSLILDKPGVSLVVLP